MSRARWSGRARRGAPICSTGRSPCPILARERERELAAFDLASLGAPEHAEALCERIAATGALDEARERALGVVAEAKAALPETLPNGGSELLHLVADAVVERYR